MQQCDSSILRRSVVVLHAPWSQAAQVVQFASRLATFVASNGGHAPHALLVELHGSVQDVPWRSMFVGHTTSRRRAGQPRDLTLAVAMQWMVRRLALALSSSAGTLCKVTSRVLLDDVPRYVQRVGVSTTSIPTIVWFVSTPTADITLASCHAAAQLRHQVARGMIRTAEAQAAVQVTPSILLVWREGMRAHKDGTPWVSPPPLPETPTEQGTPVLSSLHRHSVDRHAEMARRAQVSLLPQFLHGRQHVPGTTQRASTASGEGACQKQMVVGAALATEQERMTSLALEEQAKAALHGGDSWTVIEMSVVAGVAVVLGAALYSWARHL